MGHVYERRTFQKLTTFGKNLDTIASSVSTILAKMQQDKFDEMYVAFSDHSIKTIEKMLENASLSVTMAEKQVDAKRNSEPNPYEENEEKAEDMRERRAKENAPKGKRGRPKKGTP